MIWRADRKSANPKFRKGRRGPELESGPEWRRSPRHGSSHPDPKSPRRRAISLTLDGSRAAPDPAVPTVTPVMPAAQPDAGIFTRRAERSRSAWKRDGSSGASVVSTTIFWTLNVGNDPRRRRPSEKVFESTVGPDANPGGATNSPGRDRSGNHRRPRDRSRVFRFS